MTVLGDEFADLDALEKALADGAEAPEAVVASSRTRPVARLPTAARPAQR
ncbi:hypothetical protein ACFQ0M_34530 [Kitasatospora aburaviensis]